ncbi:hypothetical protein HG535_0B06220 [Zygotorulaspora mrakii]|uniref:Uncharacterized protein n=1 Tax=Zygotorulaspora mrakii TaxID=42260 RepID=A0A7H9AZG5_ZYGMR|nr:uncharacterized protein HG535_0B06220 [Zygotorulaspora mrakii]QLG71577.1 hypothetical protein HG535_0B06220 [Zygotorulaspora mrakii]
MCAVRPHAAAASRLRCAGVSETRYDIPETTWPGRMRIGVANPDISCAVMQRPAAVRGDVSAGLGQLTRRGPCPAAKRGGRGARVSPRTTRKRDTSAFRTRGARRAGCKLARWSRGRLAHSAAATVLRRAYVALVTWRVSGLDLEMSLGLDTRGGKGSGSACRVMCMSCRMPVETNINNSFSKRRKYI